MQSQLKGQFLRIESSQRPFLVGYLLICFGWQYKQYKIYSFLQNDNEQYSCIQITTTNKICLNRNLYGGFQQGNLVQVFTNVPKVKISKVQSGNYCWMLPRSSKYTYHMLRKFKKLHQKWPETTIYKEGPSSTSEV